MKHAEFKRERHFFLDNHGKRIYCVEYLPDATNDIKYGIILCKPIWGERIRTHCIFTNLARLLRSEGFRIITCDYFGDGNSPGDTLDLTYSSMAEDIKSLHGYFSDRYQLKDFALVGFRIGANCATEVEKYITNLRKMILIEPTMNLIDELKIGLRANLSTQMTVHKKIIKNRELLIEDIKNGIPVNMDGFLIGKSLWASFEEASPLKVDSNFDAPVLILSLIEKGRKGNNYEDLASKYKNGKFERLEKEFVWHDWKKNVPKPAAFLKKVKSELVSDLITFKQRTNHHV